MVVLLKNLFILLKCRKNLIIKKKFCLNWIFPGYDSIPIDPMEGLEIESQVPNTSFDPMDVGDSGPIDFDNLDADLPPPPPPPTTTTTTTTQDNQNNPLAGWYDTDL